MMSNIPNPAEQGLLDLAVELSVRDITAGNEFAIFVLVKNPFSRPVWVREVNVSLPSELMRIDDQDMEKRATEAKARQQQQLQDAKEERTQLQGQINDLKTHVLQLSENLESAEDEVKSKLKSIVWRLERQIENFEEKLRGLNLGTTNISVYDGAQVDKIRIGSSLTSISIYDDTQKEGEIKKDPTKVNRIEVYEPWLVYEELTQARTIKLKSSLPDNVALQPGSTAVYTVVMNVRRSLIFTPSKYRLQFYVNYGFDPQAAESNIEVQYQSGSIFTNTIAHELSIRPSVYSVLTGSVLGGIVGALARTLQIPDTFSFQGGTVSVALAAILSAIAVVFMARKSDTQSFVSVEDFWGGLLIGFLVGYTGTSFFETLTGAAANKP